MAATVDILKYDTNQATNFCLRWHQFIGHLKISECRQNVDFVSFYLDWLFITNAENSS